MLLCLIDCYVVFCCFYVIMSSWTLQCLLERYTVFFVCKDNNFLLKLVKEPSFFLRKVWFFSFCLSFRLEIISEILFYCYFRLVFRSRLCFCLGCYPGLLARYPFGVFLLVAFYPRGVTPVCLLVTPSGCLGLVAVCSVSPQRGKKLSAQGNTLGNGVGETVAL